jgi:hypothetical protein
MGKRKTSKKRSQNQRGRGKSENPLRGGNNVPELRQLGTALGELPFVASYASKLAEYVAHTDYSEMWNDAAFLARRNPAATFTVCLAAGVLTAQLAQGRLRGRTGRIGISGRRSQKQSD